VADPPDEPQRKWARISVLVVLAILILVGGWAAIHYLGPKIAARLHKHSGDPAYSAPARASSGTHTTTAGPSSTSDPADANVTAVSSPAASPSSPASGGPH
jgi:hypothetical protein